MSRVSVFAVLVVWCGSLAAAVFVTSHVYGEREKQREFDALKQHAAAIEKEIAGIEKDRDAAIAQIEVEKRRIVSSATARPVIVHVGRLPEPLPVIDPAALDPAILAAIMPKDAPLPKGPLAILSEANQVALAVRLEDCRKAEVDSTACNLVAAKQRVELDDKDKQIMIAKGGSKLARLWKYAKIGGVFIVVGIAVDEVFLRRKK